MANARKALLIDQQDYVAHFALGRLLSMDGDNQAGIRELETSIAINPSFANGYLGLAQVHLFAGHAEKAMTYADMAIRLSPNDPLLWMVLGTKSMIFMLEGDLESALEISEQTCRFPNVQFIPLIGLAALYKMSGRDEDAAVSLAEARRLEPNLTMKYVEDYFGRGDHDAFETVIEAIRSIGLPEGEKSPAN